MSWVSLSASEGGDSGAQNYKEAATQAFAHPAALGKTLGKRNSKDGLSASSSGSAAGRRSPSIAPNGGDAEAFGEMFSSTSVVMTKDSKSTAKSSSKSKLESMAMEHNQPNNQTLLSKPSSSSKSLASTILESVANQVAQVASEHSKSQMASPSPSSQANSSIHSSKPSSQKSLGAGSQKSLGAGSKGSKSKLGKVASLHSKASYGANSVHPKDSVPSSVRCDDPDMNGKPPSSNWELGLGASTIQTKDSAVSRRSVAQQPSRSGADIQTKNSAVSKRSIVQQPSRNGADIQTKDSAVSKRSVVQQPSRSGADIQTKKSAVSKRSVAQQPSRSGADIQTKNSAVSKRSVAQQPSRSEADSINSMSTGSRKDLDLKHNDNSFSVIGGLVVEFFQSKQRPGVDRVKLTMKDLAQLDRLAPSRVRGNFVEAVRYRFTNAPIGSNNSNSLHKLVRQCHELGLDAVGPDNPLLMASQVEPEAEALLPAPKASGSESVSASSRVSASAAQSVTTNSASDDEHSNHISKKSSEFNESGSKASGSGYDASTSAHVSESGFSSGNASKSSNYNGGSDNNEATTGSKSESHSGSTVAPLTRLTASVSVPDTRQKTKRGASGASVSTSLTRMGVEVPLTGQQISSANRPNPALETQDEGFVTTSLTRHGIDMSENPSNTESSYRMWPSAGTQTSSSVLPYSSASHAGDMSKNNGQLAEMASSNLSSKKSDESSFRLDVGSEDLSLTNEGLARQQLMAELREASNLMAESKTQEAAKFWSDHVVELQARLQALTGEDASVASSTLSKAILKDNDQSTNQDNDQDNDQSTNQSTNQQPESQSQSQPVTILSVEDSSVNRLALSDQYEPPFAALHNNVESISQVGENRLETGTLSTPLSTPINAIDPSLEGVPMVDVVAPADLPGGYHFEAEIEGRRFLATVPAGGVQKGETFSCYMRDLEKVGSDVPVGRWRDGLFDCCSIGCCHPVIFNALFCPLILLGQIMTRVGFDFLGRPSTNNVNGPKTLWTIVGFWVFVNLALFCAYNLKWSQGMELSMADLGALAFVNIAYTLFVVYLTSATRGSLREKYYIRESRFHDLEDCCCATFCLPFSVCQMARHTVDYNEHTGVCCNDTGLPVTYKIEDSTPKQRGNNKYLV